MLFDLAVEDLHVIKTEVSVRATGHVLLNISLPSPPRMLQDLINARSLSRVQPHHVVYHALGIGGEVWCIIRSPALEPTVGIFRCLCLRDLGGRPEKRSPFFVVDVF